VGMLGEDRADEFTMDKVEEMEVDYGAAMQKRAAYQAEVEAKRNQPKPATEVTVSIDSIAMPSKQTRPVLMAVATEGGGIINQHFGKAKEFLVYEASPTDVRFVGIRRADNYCTGPSECGSGESRLPEIIQSLEGCEVLLCAQVGYAPWKKLEAAGIQPNGEHAMEPIEDAVATVYREMQASGKLAEDALSLSIRNSA
jgi:nitrogen fixation protein NifB